MAQGISAQKSAGIVNRGVMSNGCKYIEKVTINLLGEAHTVCRDDWKTACAKQC